MVGTGRPILVLLIGMGSFDGNTYAHRSSPARSYDDWCRQEGQDDRT